MREKEKKIVFLKIKKGEGRAGRYRPVLGVCLRCCEGVCGAVNDFPRSLTRHKLYLSIKYVEPVAAIFEVYLIESNEVV